MFFSLTCGFAGFIEVVHKHRKKNTKAEKKTQRRDPGHHRASTNKPRPNTIPLPRPAGGEQLKYSHSIN